MPDYVEMGVENEVTWNKLDRTVEDFENKQHADILHDGNLNNFLSKSENRLNKKLQLEDASYPHSYYTWSMKGHEQLFWKKTSQVFQTKIFFTLCFL